MPKPSDYRRTCLSCKHGRKARPEERPAWPWGQPDHVRTHWCGLLAVATEPHSSPNSCVLPTPPGCAWEPKSTKED